MVLWYLNDQNLLFVDSHYPDLLVDVKVADLEVHPDGPLLLCIGEGAKHTLVIEREKLPLLTETNPSQVGHRRCGTLSIDKNSIVSSRHVDDLNAHSLRS